MADTLRGFLVVEDLLDPWLRYQMQIERYEKADGIRLWKSSAQHVLIHTIFTDTALILTTMTPWTVQTFSPGLGQSRSREALLGMLPGRHHSSEIICSGR